MTTNVRRNKNVTQMRVGLNSRPKVLDLSNPGDPYSKTYWLGHLSSSQDTEAVHDERAKTTEVRRVTCLLLEL